MSNDLEYIHSSTWIPDSLSYKALHALASASLPSLSPSLLTALSKRHMPLLCFLK